MRSPWRSAARLLSFAAGALALGLLGLVLGVPLLVDQPRIRTALQERLSTQVHGTMTWDRLQLRLLPTPHGVLDRPRVEIPGLLDVRAGRLEASLRLWPLLRGHVEVASLTAVDAQVRLELAPAPAAARAGAAEQLPDPATAYRAAAGAAARVLQTFAPDTQLAIEGGRLQLRLAGLPPLQLHALELRARTAASRAVLQLTCASEHWKHLSLEAEFAYADLSGRTSLELEDVDLRAWVERAMQSTGARLAIAPLRVRASLQTDDRANALTGRVEASTRSVQVTYGARVFDVPGVAVRAAVTTDSQRAQVQLEDLRVAGEKLIAGGLEYAYADRELLGRFAFDLDAARVLALARRVLAKVEGGGLPGIEKAGGSLRGSAHLAHKAGRWRAGLQLQDADAAFGLKPLPWPVLLRAGNAEWESGQVSASAIGANFGRSSVAAFAVRLRLGNELRVVAAEGKASLDLDQLYPWLRQQPALVQALRGVPAITGQTDVELLRASGRVSSLQFEARALPRRVRIHADALPGPLTVDGGAARITRSAADLQKLEVGLLDARAIVSGSAAGMGTPEFRVQARLAEGSAGPKAVGWILAQVKAPSQLALRTPFAFEAERLDWGPGGRLESSARIRFDQATSAALELSWQPGMFDLRRVHVQAAQGESTLALRAHGRRVEGRFNGSMHGAVLAYFLKDAGRYSGRVAGDLRFAADLDHLRHASAEGQLSGEGVDFTWLAGRPVLVEKFAVEADGGVLRIGEVSVRSGKDSATLRGELRRGERGPVVDASIESEGVVLDRLLALDRKDGPQAAEAPAAEASTAPPKVPRAKPSVELDFKDLWPLPVTGRIGLRAGFVQYGQHRVAPVALMLNLEPDRAHLDVEQAKLCGIDLPFVVEARAGVWSASARLAAMKQPVAQMVACLTGERVQITGEADFDVALKTQGGAGELLRNLEGTGKAQVRDGRIQKFALIGNVLSLVDIEDLPQTAEDLASGAQGFRFRRILAAGRLGGGQFTLDEGAFESQAVGMAASGTIRLSDYDTRMTVLVAPFGKVDRLVRGIPVIGYVIGGTLTSIPVGVSGDIRSPIVVPLGPRAVTNELLGIFERTLKLPARMAEPPVRQ